jgi:hypothetical protein
MPGLVKIGYTEKDDVNERKDELYYQGKPGVPFPFILEHSKYTVCPDKAEDEIHKRLWEYRINEDREFFKIKASKAKDITNQVIAEAEKILVNHFNKLPFK